MCLILGTMLDHRIGLHFVGENVAVRIVTSLYIALSYHAKTSLVNPIEEFSDKDT